LALLGVYGAFGLDGLAHYTLALCSEHTVLANVTIWSEALTGLLLITPWDRLAHVGAHHYPWLPVKWMLRDDYDSQARLARFDRPVLVVVAERDSIVPARFGRALHTGLEGPKRLVLIEAADHNDWAERVDAGWWRTAVAFSLGVEFKAPVP